MKLEIMNPLYRFLNIFWNNDENNNELVKDFSSWKIALKEIFGKSSTN